MLVDLPNARRDAIAARLADGQPVSAGALAAEFEVSEDAIRRDLRALAAEGKCRRVYGGALPISPISAPMAARIEGDQGHKRALARAAATTIRPGEFLFLDSGSTNLALVEFLPEDNDLTIATNSIDIAAAALRRQDLKLIVLGGEADPIIGGCVDAVALQALVQMRFDRAFIGACSVSEEGVGAAQLADATFKRSVIARAERTVVLIANDKLDRAAPHQVAALGQIDMLVVEASASAAQRASLDAAGCRAILVADPA
ncbi:MULTISPECIES: DeoR/GlpR family DNA-binding transcription regulator [unclassified Sphingomonas]|uniref:DeoR/GlpR family DNA-binding transcription regulator n=1 Tax=Sphingomonas TaxID=13687 RepID=UPI000959CDBC|nr:MULTISPECIES: DeoR/GlpR family DNA-binding transcription regulator [unclassified Sphingomonas]MBN8810775.1 DeoR/GlpR transcriptional regulator [Sphingomonas sp.]OJY49325.1 MAG: DeoR family transcriptional regulator [Sphingomonas sp. 67-41]